jgi:hypothetical protein
MLSRSLAAHADRVPRSGYRGSDFVLWHKAEDLGIAANPTGMEGYN